jgi:guanylate kinase
LKSTIDEALSHDKIMILDTDTVGAKNLKNLYADSVLIFIIPPSPEDLFNRLNNRETESPEIIEKRFNIAPRELAHIHEYDYIVVNDILSTAVSQIIKIIDVECMRSGRVTPYLTAWRNNGIA